MTVRRFRKRPVEIEAIQLDQMNASAVAKWCGGDENNFDTLDDGIAIWTGVTIPTLEGTMTCSPGDWVIRGVAGEFYPCKPDIFDATYEAVDA